MSITYKIDWMTFTKNKWEIETAGIDNRASALAWANIAMQEIGLWIPELKSRGGGRFYPWVWEDVLTGAQISVPIDPSVQGIMIVFSGSTLSDPRWAHRILSTALDHGWKTTRFDVAIDLMEESYTAKTAHDEWLWNDEKKNVTTQWIQGKTGNSFYLGSRQSNRYARVYDKGRQQNTPHQWTRFEVEYKGGLAMVAGEKFASSPLNVLGDISDYYKAGLPILSALVAGLSSEPGTKFKLPMRVQGDRERWFNTQVAQALRTWADEDYDNARAWLTGMMLILDGGN